MLEFENQLWTPVKLQYKSLYYWFDANDNTTFAYDKNNGIFILKDKSGNNRHFLQKVFAFCRKVVITLMGIFKIL
jgi:hypothetical protein